MSALKNSYPAWKDRVLSVVTDKAELVNYDGHFDPAHFDCSNIDALHSHWFSMLTVGFWGVDPMKSASQVYAELTKIDEFEALDSKDLFIADHDVSWRKCKRSEEESVQRFHAQVAEVLARSHVVPAASKDEAIDNILKAAHRFTEPWNSELNMAVHAWDDALWRAVVANLAYLLSQWLNNCEAADSPYRDFICSVVANNRSMDLDPVETVKLRQYIGELVKPITLREAAA